MNTRLRSTALAVLFAAMPSALAAQQSLTGQIGDLIRFGSCGQPLCLVTGAGTHQTHFLISAQSASTQLSEFLTNSITASVGRLPISATSSGTSFKFVNGAPVQSTSSFGPIFAERAATMGQGRYLIGVSTSNIAFSKLRGQSMDKISINLTHQDVGAPGLGNDPTESDVVGIDLKMKISLQVSTLSATYGVTDRLDVSVAVPIIASSLEATGFAQIYNPTGLITGFHNFGTVQAPTSSARDTVKGSSSGLGDITARAKFNIKNTSTSGLAILANVRIPIGDESNFRGAGAVAANALLIGSATYGNFSPHANVGYALRTGTSENNALLGSFGFDQMLNKRATLAVDILSEFQAGGDAGKLPPNVTFSAASPVRTVQGSNIPNEKDNPIALSAGGRFLVNGYTLLANGVKPIKSGGMQANFIWTLGLERVF